MNLTSLASQGLSALAEIAPTLAGMVGGPLAGTAVTALESVLGLGANTDANGAPDLNKALAAVVGATPDQLLALKAEDNRHAEALQKAGLDLEVLQAKDRDSARQREAAVKDWVPQALAVLLTVGFFGLLFWMAIHETPPGSRDVLNIMTGALASGWVNVISYYFGSSKGADDLRKASLVK